MFDDEMLHGDHLKLDLKNDGRHQLDPTRPYDRESIPYLVHMPDEGIAMFTYTYVNKDSEAGAAIAIFGPGVGDEPIQVKLADRKVPLDMNFSDWYFDDFKMKQDLKFCNAEVSWQSKEASIDLKFEATHPPYAYSAHADGCPPYAATNRIEQSGTVTGQLKLGDRIIKIDTTGHRDHSWGSRDWTAFLNYRWFQGQVGADISVHFWHLHALGETKLYGYVFKDGVMAQISDLDFSCEQDSNFDQQFMTAIIQDEAGRTTEVKADFYAHYSLVPQPNITLREGAAKAWFDGREGVGWMEVAWPTEYRNHIIANDLYGEGK